MAFPNLRQPPTAPVKRGAEANRHRGRKTGWFREGLLKRLALPVSVLPDAGQLRASQIVR